MKILNMNHRLRFFLFVASIAGMLGCMPARAPAPPLPEVVALSVDILAHSQVELGAARWLDRKRVLGELDRRGLEPSDANAREAALAASDERWSHISAAASNLRAEVATFQVAFARDGAAETLLVQEALCAFAAALSPALRMMVFHSSPLRCP